ncbi:surfeit locus protein 2 [Pseudophryne corroboree]|uniref:surfeit locus protein 2 n=1 Tax=Pseudophryne corroboree TaxID=495146 RepID=UPI00308124D7
MDVMSEDVRQFLRLHPNLQLIPESNKVRFALTGHELPCRLRDLQSFTEGKKYKQLSKMSTSFDYSTFEPHIVPSTKNEQQLFCKLTLRHINRLPEHVQRHVQGKRYLKALSKYEECQKQGVPYVPACLRNKKSQRHSGGEQPAVKKGQLWEHDNSDSEDSDSGDSMSDLYPAHIFTKKNQEGEENGKSQSTSDDEMEVEGNSHNNQCKRSQPQSGPSRKKLKSHHKKSKNFKKSTKK